MLHVFLVIQLILALALIAAVLVQRSDSDGFGLGSGSGMNFLSGRASANLLTRSTAIIAALFILNSLALSIMASNRDGTSLADRIEALEESKPLIVDTPQDVTAEPEAPAAEETQQAPLQVPTAE